MITTDDGDIYFPDSITTTYDGGGGGGGGTLFSFDRIIPFLWKCGSIAFGIAAIALGLLYAKQDQLLYFPEIGGIPRRPGSNPRRYRSPAEYKIPYESHMIPTEDGISIHSWLLLHPHSKQDNLPTLLFFHGNAGNIGLRLPNAIQMFHLLNANILMVEYRGYGDSQTVKPTERGLKRDAEASLRFIHQHPHIDPSKVFVFGRSLGGAVAFHLAQYASQQNLQLRGLILENTFLSIGRMVDVLMPAIAPLKMLVLRIHWDSEQIVKQLTLPVLYLSGAKDQLVPPEHMRELYGWSSKVSVCARMHVVKDGTHNETWLQGGTIYWDKIRSFIAEALLITTPPTTTTTNHVHQSSIGSISDDIQSNSADLSSLLTVGMGTEVDSSSSKSSIPTMSNSFLGIAREASSSVVNLSTTTTTTTRDSVKQKEN